MDLDRKPRRLFVMMGTALVVPVCATLIFACGRTALLDEEPWSAAPSTIVDGGLGSGAQGPDDTDGDASATIGAGIGPQPDIDLATACLVKHNKVVFIGAYERQGEPFVDEAPAGQWTLSIVNDSAHQPQWIYVAETPWAA